MMETNRVERPKVSRILISVDCPCGDEIEFDDVEEMTMESIPCDTCGRRVEVSVDVFVHIRK